MRFAHARSCRNGTFLSEYFFRIFIEIFHNLYQIIIAIVIVIYSLRLLQVVSTIATVLPSSTFSIAIVKSFTKTHQSSEVQSLLEFFCDPLRARLAILC
jgi:hypothetical protein